VGRTKEFFKWAGKTVAGKLLGEAFGWKTVAPVLASLWAVASAALLPIVRGTYQMRGWWLATIGGYAAAVTVLVGLFAYRSRKLRRSAFNPVMVQDREHEMEWHLLDNPIHWVRRDLWKETPFVVNQILAGPFHFVERCRDDLYFLVEEDRFEGPKLRPLCPRCDYGNDDSEPLAKPEVVESLRLMALRELQRLHRNGVDLTRTVALKEPYYGTKIVKREAVQSTDFLSE
jgi:hypothetical protein